MNVKKIATISSFGILGVGILTMVGYQVSDSTIAENDTHVYQSTKNKVFVDNPEGYPFGVAASEGISLEDIISDYELINKAEFINIPIEPTENIMKLKQAAQITAINLIIATTPVFADEAEDNLSAITETDSGYVEGAKNTVSEKVQSKVDDAETAIAGKFEADAAEAEEAIVEKAVEDADEIKDIASEKVQSDIAEARDVVADNVKADVDEVRDDIADGVDSAKSVANQVKSDVEENWGDWESTVSATVSETLDDVNSKLGNASSTLTNNVDESVAGIKEDGLSEESAQEVVSDFQDDVANSDFVSDVESVEDATGVSLDDVMIQNMN
ncbi:hypothetical protein A9Q81_13765 [Gammaproteobacteria bacterium 42_54_T18]|nr:hypothetical protein A9Q81_13765 [Gammaproteobacteria bacterium 42_54_T18]